MSPVEFDIDHGIRVRLHLKMVPHLRLCIQTLLLGGSLLIHTRTFSGFLIYTKMCPSPNPTANASLSFPWENHASDATWPLKGRHRRLNRSPVLKFQVHRQESSSSVFFFQRDSETTNIQHLPPLINIEPSLDMARALIGASWPHKVRSSDTSWSSA